MPKPPRTIALGVTIAVVVMGVRLVTDVAQPSASVGAVVAGGPATAAEPAPASPLPLSPIGPAAMPGPVAAMATLDLDSPRRLEMARYLAPDGLASFIAANAAEPDPSSTIPGATPILGPLAELPAAPAVPR